MRIRLFRTVVTEDGLRIPWVNSSIARYWWALAGCLLGAALIGPAQQAYGTPVTINLDSVDTSGGPVQGQPVVDFLAGYGISVAFSPSQNLPVIGPSGFDSITAAPQTNMFSMINVYDSNTDMTLTFATPLSNFSFTRCAELYGPNSWCQWSATAYDGTTELESVGEGMADAYGTYYPTPSTFSLSGSDIASIVFEENNENFAGNPVAFDNLVLTPVPEPAIVSLLAIAGSALLLRRRR